VERRANFYSVSAEITKTHAAEPLDMPFEIVRVSGNETGDLDGDRIRRVGIAEPCAVVNGKG
jgi:hypothetical protein